VITELAAGVAGAGEVEDRANVLERKDAVDIDREQTPFRGVCQFGELGAVRADPAPCSAGIAQAGTCSPRSRGCDLPGSPRTASTYWYLSADVTSRRGRRRPTRQLFGAARPVATTVVGAGLLDPCWKGEIKAEAVAGG
jgi:hypothetical protein